MIALLAVYPGGVYGRPAERRLVRVVAGLAVAVPIALLLARPTLQPSWVFAWGADPAGSPDGDFPEIASPIHVEALAFLGAPLRAYLDASLALAPLVGAVLAGLHYRRLRAAQQLQLRWPMYGVLLVLVAPLAVALHEAGVLSLAISDLIVVVGLVALPASAAIGLVRPDLFDVDRAMRRSLVYLPVWIAIGGAYVGVAAALGLAASGAGLQIAILVTIVATRAVRACSPCPRPARRTLGLRRALGGEELIRRLGATLGAHAGQRAADRRDRRHRARGARGRAGRGSRSTASTR